MQVRLAFYFFMQLVPRRRIAEARDGVEPLERIAVVKNPAGIETVAALDIGIAPAELAIDRGPADQHRNAQPAPVQLFDNQRHLPAGRDQQRGEANRVCLLLDRRIDDAVNRDLLAQVEHRITIVAENRLHQILADVMHVAKDGGEHHLPPRIAVGLLHELLEIADRFLHHLRALQHEGQDQFAGAEPVANFLHCPEQNVIDHGDRAARLQAGIECDRQILLLPIDDHVVHPRFRRRVDHLCRGLLLQRAAGRIEMGDQPRQRILPAREHQILGQLTALERNLVPGDDVLWIDDRGSESLPQCVSQEDRIQDGPRRFGQPEADIGDAENGSRAGQVLFDQRDSLQCLERRIPILLFTGREREREYVKE